MAKTPRIQLVLNLRGQDEPQEQIKKITKAHEVVEVDGFTFKRRRTGTLRPAENEGPNSQAGLLKTPHGQRAVQGLVAAAAQSPCAQDDLVLTKELYQRLSAGLQALPDSAPPAQHLALFADSACGAEADLAGDAGVAGALAEVFAAFNLSLHAALAGGDVQASFRPEPAAGAATPGGEGGHLGPGYHVDLAARKAGLRARLNNFTKEEAEWQSLLLKVEQLDVPEGEGKTDAGPEAAAPEEAAPPAEVLALQQMQTSIHRQLSIQVDGVCTLVSNVEELVEAANAAAGALQAEYHADKFRTFPLVDSPKKLIRELIKPVRAAAPAPGN